MTRSLSESTLLSVALFFATAIAALSQALPPPDGESVRVNVTVNSDGSRTVYEFDRPNRKATATTTERDGKTRNKIRYQLDDADRFSSGLVYGPDGKLRFKTTYRYDGAGRIEQETQLSPSDQVLSRIVYSYDSAGKQIGYSIFDGANKLIQRTSAPTPTPTPKPRKK